MSSKNSKHTKQTGVTGPVSQTVMLWAAVIALTALRLSVATSGAMTEREAFLSVCAAHPAGGYVEGPAGVPLLLNLLSFLQLLGGSAVFVLRWIAPIFVLLLSWCVWWIGRKVAPHRPAVALWVVLGVNLLPTVNLASLVMDGAMVTASLILLTIVAGWHAALFKGGSGGATLRVWAVFGATLAVTTLFYQPVGWLLPAALAYRFVREGFRAIPWRGVAAALALLALGWVLPLSWNAKHDWIQWSSVAASFDSIQLGSHSLSLGVLVVVTALLVPFLVSLAYRGREWRWAVLLLALALSGVSALLLVAPTLIPAGFLSPQGVQGVGHLAASVIALRDARPDVQGEKSFLIASSSGLASLLGEWIRIEYPERPGAPSVFVAESPSLNSSYALWPGYPDAVGAGIKDTLYTQEKTTSPFLGRNALYITTEANGELPQTITGAFGAVGLLQEIPLKINGREVPVRIYQCEDYRTLSL